MNTPNPLPIPLYGFDVSIADPAYQKVGRVMVPWFDEHRLSAAVARRLVAARGRFTGAHVYFVRHNLGLTQAELAELLGVTHPAVVRWEKLRNEPTRMNRCNEIVLRQILAESIGGNVATNAQIRAAVCDGETVAPMLIPNAEIALRTKQATFQWMPGTSAHTGIAVITNRPAA